MPPKPVNWRMYGKMAVVGATCSIGGPALVYYVSPSEEEVFLQYNPELQKRSLENRLGRQQDFDNFVGRLKQYSKSDKPIWAAAVEQERRTREGQIVEQAKLMGEMRATKEEIQKSSLGLVPGNR